MYYLETNALVNIIDRLGEINSVGKCYSSILTLLEILKNTTETNFQQKKRVICRIVESPLPIDYDIPIEKIQNAFGVGNIKKRYKDRFIPLLELIIKCDTLGEIFDYLSVNSTSFTEINGIFSVYENALNSFFSEEKYEEYMPKLTKKMINKRIAEENIQFTREFLEQTNWDKILTGVFFHAGLIAECFPENLASSSLPLIISRYDWSLDRYFCAFLYYFRKRILFREQNKRNDLVDLQHFLYLQNETCKIVTSDKMILKICKLLFPRSCLDFHEFQHKFGEQSFYS